MLCAMRWHLAAGSSLIVALAAACGASAPVEEGKGPGGSSGQGDGGDTPAVTGLPCDVDAVLAANCRTCHSATPQFGAPMPLVTHADLTAPAKSDPSRKVYELVLERTASDAAPMPPPPNERLAASERDKLVAWVEAGTPTSTEACGTSPGPGEDFGVACTPDLKLAPASAYEMPASTKDEYVCWGVDLQSPTPKHVTAFVPRIDNAKITHHIVLFEADSAYPSTPQPCSAGGSLQWRMVMGWAPGGKGLELPPEAGFPIKTTGTTHYVVQMHYSNVGGLSGETDASGFDLCTGPPRANEADVLAFGTQSFTIQPGVHTEDCTLSVPAQVPEIRLIAAMPHMHQLGTAMSTTLVPGGGGPEIDLGSAPNYSFDTQVWYPIDATVKGGDVVRTRCTWTNDTGQSVSFGEKTTEEMCYSFTLYYPRVQLPLWSWAAPAVASECN
jgi:hypothetical protein